MTATDELEFPEKGILWRGWNEETLKIIGEKQMPVLLFIPDQSGLVWPFLREIFREMPKNSKLRELLHESFPALFIKADDLPRELKALGAGSDYHIAVLSPFGLTPLITFNPIRGNAAEVVNDIVTTLERLREAWR